MPTVRLLVLKVGELVAQLYVLVSTKVNVVAPGNLYITPVVVRTSVVIVCQG